MLPGETTTAEEIIAAYRKCRSVTKVSRELHLGSIRVVRVLDAAGIARRRRSDERQSPDRKIPEHYLAAIHDYQRGVSTGVLKETYRVSLTYLYHWMRKMDIPRRMQLRAPPEKHHCWECGARTSDGEMFCCDRHRREYNKAAIRPGFKPPVHHRTEEQCQSIA